MSDLTPERLRGLLAYDPETGIFRWKVARGHRKVGDEAGGIALGYVVIGVDGRHYRAHRLAWLYVYGFWPLDCIDHINGVPTDNRLANLRDVDRSLNLQNQTRSHKGSLSPYLGVDRIKRSGRWRAQILAGGKKKNLGHFDTEESAHEAYLAAKIELHPGAV